MSNFLERIDALIFTQILLPARIELSRIPEKILDNIISKSSFILNLFN